MIRRAGCAIPQAGGFFLLVTVLSGCALGPDYVRPDIALPSQYPLARDIETTTADRPLLDKKWWTLFSDDMLNDIVESTHNNNAELQRAVAQIDEAAAALAEVGAAAIPQVDLGASSQRSLSSSLNAQPLQAGTPAISNSHRLAVSTIFELDFWGKIRRSSEAARAQLLSTRYAREVVGLSLAGTAAQAYFLLRSLDAQIVVTSEILALRDESLMVIKNRASGGMASELEVNQASVERADAAIRLRELQRQRALLEHQLALLSGRLDLRIVPGDILRMPVPALPPPGLPSTLLEQRPDVQQAEQSLVAANARIGVATAAQFPTVTLTGNFGGQSADLGDLLKSGARIWSLGLGASLPVIDAGRYKARTQKAEAVQKQAEAAYRSAVESAFREVADALTNVQASRETVEDVQSRLDAARNVLRLSNLRYEAGYSAYLEVLDAQRSVYDAEIALIQNRQLQLAYSVDLIKALGGGWSPDQLRASALNH